MALCTRRNFIRGLAAGAVVAAAGEPFVHHRIQTHALDARAVRLSLGLPQPLRVAALGDIHFDPLYEEAYVARIAARVTDLKADLIIYTGDFVTASVARMRNLAALLAGGVARLGSYATLGNHDHWSGAAAVTQALESRGIRVLRNSSIAIPGEENVYLSALDSFWAGTPNPSMLARTPPDSRHILLVHEPDPFATLDDPRIKLQISGHTHGGQVRVPFVGALRLPKWGRNYQEGLYARDGRYLYVNRGVGTISPHVRFRCAPEITVFELS
jgi:predicted MPP superfamily phosphohydrolase